MRIHVRLRLPDASEVSLAPGDVIGRMARAALRIQDPRISEAHALVSLRGAELRLLALRGRLGVEGKPRTEVKLVPGVRVVLGAYLPLVVTEVSLPPEVPILSINSGAASIDVPLDGVFALHPSPPYLVSGFDPQALATLWPGDEGAWVRPPDAPDRLLRAGERVRIGDLDVGLTLAASAVLDHGATLDGGRSDIALRLVLHYDTVHVHASDGSSVVIDGLAARLVCELAQLATPVAWSALAPTLWPGEDDLGVLRQRWDKTTSRLRKRLIEGRLRHDLVRASHAGLVELFLGPEDRVEDHS